LCTKHRRGKGAYVLDHESADHDTWWLEMQTKCKQTTDNSKTTATLKGKLDAVADNGDCLFVRHPGWLLGQLIVLALVLLFPHFCFDCLLLLFEREKFYNCWAIFRISMDLLVRKSLGHHTINSAHQKHCAKSKHKRRRLLDWQGICWLGCKSSALSLLSEKHGSFDHTCSLCSEAATVMDFSMVEDPNDVIHKFAVCSLLFSYLWFGKRMKKLCMECTIHAWLVLWRLQPLASRAQAAWFVLLLL